MHSFFNLSRTGPAPRFDSYHIWKALVVVRDDGPISRGALADAVGIGEGSIRSILSTLLEGGAVRIEKKGVVLTPGGGELLDSLAIATAEIPSTWLTLDDCNVAALVRGKAGEIRAGVEQRDEAIKVGASGATTLVLKDGRLRLPPHDFDVDEGYPELSAVIRERLSPEDGDVVILGSVGSVQTAEKGAVSAALALLDK